MVIVPILYFSDLPSLKVKLTWYRSYTDVNPTLLIVHAFRQQQQLQQQDQTPNLRDKPTRSSTTLEADPSMGVFLDYFQHWNVYGFSPLCCDLFPCFPCLFTSSLQQPFRLSQPLLFLAVKGRITSLKSVLIQMSLFCFKVKSITIRSLEFWLCFLFIYFWLEITDCNLWLDLCQQFVF